MKKFIPIIILLIIAVGGGAFYGGMKYQQSKIPQGFAQEREMMNASTTGPGPRNGNSAANFISGEILSKDDSSITIKIQDGGSKIVFYSASTTVSKMATGSANDIAVDSQIMVSGQQNSDGSYTAQTIQIGQLSR